MVFSKYLQSVIFKGSMSDIEVSVSRENSYITINSDPAVIDLSAQELEAFIVLLQESLSYLKEQK